MITCLLFSDEFTSFTSYYLTDRLRKWFNIEFYDSTKTYNKSDVFFLVNWSADNEKIKQLRNDNYKVIVDSLWEIPDTEEDTLYSDVWFWINESLWYQSLGYDQYVPNKVYTKRALMPLRLAHPWRVELFSTIQQEGLLDQLLYSFVERGITLEGTEDPDQRNFNSLWYDSTYFSIVSESQLCRIFITEKTFKPIAFQHPYLIYGAPKTLDFLHKHSFETFPNLFDESYDTMYNDKDRLNTIIENIKNFELREYDSETLDKLTHNKNRFFNSDIVHGLLKSEVVDKVFEMIGRS